MNDSETRPSSNTDISKLELEPDSTLTRDDLNNFDFDLNLATYELQVTDQFVLTVEDARKVFLNTQNWIHKAQEYYTLNTFASDHIEISLDHSKLYETLAFFEDNPDNQTKLLKRATTVIEKVLGEVNPQYWMSYCRQMWFILGNLYSDMLNIKMEKIKETDARPNPHALSKINSLVEKSSSNFTEFMNSIKLDNSKAPTDLEKPYLQSLFHLAALQTRHISLNKQTQLSNTEKSVGYYEKFVAYCSVNESAAELVREELGVAKEMVTLLPLKIMRLQSDLRH